jgi:ketosteroid isomerase-like protein
MASREAMIEAINRAYDARARSDMDAVMAAFHADAVFELKGNKEVLEVAGASQGHPDVRAAMTGLIENFEFIKRDIVTETVEGDRVIVHSRVKIRFVPKDVVFTTELLDTFRFKDGKIIELIEFADTALLKSLVTS